MEEISQGLNEQLTPLYRALEGSDEPDCCKCLKSKDLFLTILYLANEIAKKNVDHFLIADLEKATYSHLQLSQDVCEEILSKFHQHQEAKKDTELEPSQEV